jgi:hypothetical protein
MPLSGLGAHHAQRAPDQPRYSSGGVRASRVPSPGFGWTLVPGLDQRFGHLLVHPPLPDAADAKENNMNELKKSQQHSPVVIAHQAQRATDASTPGRLERLIIMLSPRPPTP